MREWQAYILAAFAVVAGQALKVGRKIDRGEPVGTRDLLVMFSMLPAFGSMIGAAAAHYGAPTWIILLTGVAAGWIGFGAMKVVLLILRTVAGQLMGSAKTE
jgi:hypothetical protein